MTRSARDRRVVYWEEPVIGSESPCLNVEACAQSGVIVVTPQLPDGLSGSDQQRCLEGLLKSLVAEQSGELILWYYTPMMRKFSLDLAAACIGYDCMDELANFRFAPPERASLGSE